MVCPVLNKIISCETFVETADPNTTAPEDLPTVSLSQRSNDGMSSTSMQEEVESGSDWHAATQPKQHFEMREDLSGEDEEVRL